MYTIFARNVNDALQQGIGAIQEAGELCNTRNGLALAMPWPVATIYAEPAERVLFMNARDANPFFHFMESMWMIEGRQDVAFVSEFNKRMGEYSDDGTVFNAPYGYRMRYASPNKDMDQLMLVIKELMQNPESRQAVINLWDINDLTRTTKDKSCNMILVFRVQNGGVDMTVCNRSNDMIWGAYGANAVHMSFFQEYVAAHLGLEMGKYYQVSNNFHVYVTGAGGDVWDRVKHGKTIDLYTDDIIRKRIHLWQGHMGEFDRELHELFKVYDKRGLEGMICAIVPSHPLLRCVMLPMLEAWLLHKAGLTQEAISACDYIEADDWRIACTGWLVRRLK